MATRELHTRCTDCGGSDCLTIYENGSGYCFGQCSLDGKGYKRKSYLEKGDDTKDDYEQAPKGKVALATELQFTALKMRKISADICKKYGYGTAIYKLNKVEQPVQVANYYDDRGVVIAQKIRNKDKEFLFVGKSNANMLWGRHLWRNKGGRKVIITEGEIDCLSVAEAYDGKYPVVSLAGGANSVRKALTHNLEWLESFDQVVLWFDSDEAGQKALDEAKKILSPNKLYYVPFNPTHKDANDVLVAEGKVAIQNAIYEAKEFREDCIVKGSEISFEDIRKDIKRGRALPYPKLQEMTLGTRDRELWIWTAGSGIGKSTIVTEIVKYQLDSDPDMKLGVIYLEESNDKTIDRFMALDHDVPLAQLRLDHSLIPEEKAYETFQKYFANDRINLYNHFGSLGTDNLIQKMRYFVVVLGCTTLVLDHISIVVSGTDSDEGERKQLDIFMTNLRTFIEETGVAVHAIVHLKRTTGKKSFNEGGKISLSDLRGSGSLEQLSDTVIGAERDQQGDKNTLANLRVLKCRETGVTGEADTIDYIRDTGRYILADSISDEDTF